MNVLLGAMLLLGPGTRLVDDGERRADRLGTIWVSFASPNARVSPIPFVFSALETGGRSARLSYSMRPEDGSPYAGMRVILPRTDVSSYEGVRFIARGKGDWCLQVPTQATASDSNDFSAPVPLTESWARVEIPFSQLFQTRPPAHPWDPSSVLGIQWLASGFPGTKGWIEVDDVELYRRGSDRNLLPPSNPIRWEPKVDQVGYPLGGKKEFALTVRSAAGLPIPFRILDAKGRIVFAGTDTRLAVDARKTTGEWVRRIDFSAFDRPGTYTVEARGLRSQPFAIASKPYRRLASEALHCFALLRCGAFVDDRATGVRHAPCHLGDADGDDLTGGWHNADDYGKWVHEEAISCAWMMALAELRPGTPLRGVLLDEVRWGLQWMLKMQGTDGRVRHKVDARDHFCPATSPDQDPFRRQAMAGGSVDAGVFVGAMCRASRVFRPHDPKFADRCLAAAVRSWRWLEAHPNVVVDDPDYPDSNPSQEAMWALGELAATTNDDRLRKRFESEMANCPLDAPTWAAPKFFGYLAMAGVEQTAPAIAERIDRVACRYGDQSDADGYGVLTLPSEYYWESNETLLHRTALLLCAFRLTGKTRYREVALRQLHWLLGLNSLERSFVTGQGCRSIRHPHHWTSTALGTLVPGWASGGPNQFLNHADPLLGAVIVRGTPPAKCFVDANSSLGSWASNEGETSENAALVFVTGFLSSDGSGADAPWTQGKVG